MVTRVVLNPSKEKPEKLIYICEKFCFFFLSRRFLNLHFDGVYSLALGKPAKVLQYLEDEESLQERRALRKCGTGYHECTFASSSKTMLFCGQSFPLLRVSVVEKGFFLEGGWGLPVLCVYRTLGMSSPQVSASVEGALKLQERHTGPSSPKSSPDQEEGLERTSLPLAPPSLGAGGIKDWFGETCSCSVGAGEANR